jgi:hypothetical protein
MTEPTGDLWMTRFKKGLCPSCGKKGPHYVPPSVGDPGFYLCTERLLDGRVVSIEEYETSNDRSEA